MVKQKEVFEVVVDGDGIRAIDENGSLIVWFSLADTIFSKIESAGFDCNGAGLTYKNIK